MFLVDVIYRQDPLRGAVHDREKSNCYQKTDCLLV
jgi:hypothetical protein